MYLMIFETGDVCKTNGYEEGDLAAADDGYLDIIDIRDPRAPKQYHGGEWRDVEMAGA